MFNSLLDTRKLVSKRMLTYPAFNKALYTLGVPKSANCYLYQKLESNEETGWVTKTFTASPSNNGEQWEKSAHKSRRPVSGSYLEQVTYALLACLSLFIKWLSLFRSVSFLSSSKMHCPWHVVVINLGFGLLIPALTSYYLWDLGFQCISMYFNLLNLNFLILKSADTNSFFLKGFCKIRRLPYD